MSAVIVLEAEAAKYDPADGTYLLRPRNPAKDGRGRRRYFRPFWIHQSRLFDRI